MDAALVALQPVDEIFNAIDRQGYFFTTNYELLDWEASEEACRGCGVFTDFRIGKLTLAGTLMGFRKAGKLSEILGEALLVAHVEENIAAAEIAHRHDQAIISLLIYKHLGPVLLADGIVYLGSLSPKQIPGQKIWAHRRKILKSDVEHFTTHITGPGESYLPSEPYPPRRAKSLSHLYKVYWCFGRNELEEAREHLDIAFAVDPALKNEMKLLAGQLRWSSGKLEEFTGRHRTKPDFITWSIEQLNEINGPQFVDTLIDLLPNKKCAFPKLEPRSDD